MIECKNITKIYKTEAGETTVLNGISFLIEDGEFLAIMGPSGSGKSTLMHILGGLDTPTSGTYLLDGRDISKMSDDELADIRKDKIGFVFQQFNLLPRLSALANVELGMRYSSGVDRQEAKEALAKVGLSDRVNHRPTELSGGEQQRVAIARAIVKNPPLLLADEPTGNLDSRSGAEIISILSSLHAEQGITLIMITHDRDIAHHCQRIVYISDGKILKEEII